MARPPLALTAASRLLPVLRKLPPELAHNLSLNYLRAVDALHLLPAAPIADLIDHWRLQLINLPPLHFANPIGLAAGYDKNAKALRPLSKLGFGFIEVGTITPEPQRGNPKPRLFRLPADRALINRMGFNSAGLVECLPRLAARPDNLVIGINVGPNKSASVVDLLAQYRVLVAMAAPQAHYVVINVSSPNTPGLRDLQQHAFLAQILAEVRDECRQEFPRLTLVVKLSPDLTTDELTASLAVCIDHAVWGVIIANTTLSRDNLTVVPPYAGGLSGPPVFARSTKLLAQAYLIAGKQLVLIGAGGVQTGADVLTKIQAGASLVQLFTGLVYAPDGPLMVTRLQRELLAAMDQAGIATVAAAIGRQADLIAQQ